MTNSSKDSDGSKISSLGNRAGNRNAGPIGMMECGAAIGSDTMERFVGSFEKSARRWELVVYPAMLAFVVLAAYGFFLVYSLTKDMHTLARSIDPNMTAHMSQMVDSMDSLTADINTMTREVVDMTSKLDTLEPILIHIGSMDQSMRAITISNDQLRHEMTIMSRNIARPMSKMNSMFPW